MSNASKSAKTVTLKLAENSLALLIANALANIPAVLPFEETEEGKEVAPLLSSKNPAVRAMAEEMREAYIAQNSDENEKQFRAICSAIPAAQFTTFADTVRNFKKESVNAGKIAVSASQWEAAAKGDKDAKPETVKLLKDIAKERTGETPSPWSTIEEKFNLTASSRQQLYSLVNSKVIDLKNV